MKILATFITFIFSASGVCQELLPIGAWRSHFNFEAGRMVAEAGSIVYCTTESALFFFDQEDNRLAPLSKVDGLSDVGISAITYNQATGLVIIGYENGNIDLFNETEIINIKAVLNAQIIGSRSINHITTLGNLAYLSTDFGVVVLNLERREIFETYRNLGPAGEQSRVRSSAILRDSLFLATDFGVIAGNISQEINLQDFQNWKRYVSELLVVSEPVDFVTILDQKIVAGMSQGSLFLLEEAGWTNILQTQQTIRSLSPMAEGLFIAFDDQLASFDLSEGVREIVYGSNSTPSHALMSESGRIWIADRTSGLIGGTVEAGFESFLLQGPASNQTFRLYHDLDRVIALPGGFDENIAPLNNVEAYSSFEQGQWEISETASRGLGNLSGIARMPEGSLFITSFGNGFLEVESGVIVDADSENSPLTADNDQTKITGIGFDSEGNLWVANYNSLRPFHRRAPSGEWSSFDFTNTNSRYPISLAINEFDDVWSIVDPNQGGGILVFNAQTDEERYLTTGEGAGNLPNQNVTEVVFDREGQAWIGTESGVAFILDPFSIFEATGFDAIQPIFDNRPLLEEDFITSIAIDGGNRKWIGTTEGLWLFSETGEEVVVNYTIDNSPLPSNHIIDLLIEPNSGEIFISTSKGMVSLRGSSTNGTDEHNNVKIFPNPVRPGFTGTVGISGVVEDAIVKITDVGGRIVRELKAEGGTATWDTRDFSGNLAGSGIYLVLSTSSDGDETHVGKIAIIR